MIRDVGVACDIHQIVQLLIGRFLIHRLTSANPC